MQKYDTKIIGDGSNENVTKNNEQNFRRFVRSQEIRVRGRIKYIKQWTRNRK